MPSKRHLAAIMFTDIAGYTAMMQRDEKEGLAKANRYREVLKQFVEQYRGKIVQHYGDGSLSIFQSAVESLECALAIQRALLEAPEVPLRIGIHLGDIVLKDEDIYGDGVNIASRIENMGVAGSVLFSESVYQHVSNHPDLPVTFLGRYQLKNVDRPIRVYALSNPGLRMPARQGVAGKIQREFSRAAGKPPALLRKLVPVALILLLGAVALWQWSGRQDDPFKIPEVIKAGMADHFRGDKEDRVAVLPFQNRTGDESLESIGALASDWITQRLMDTEQAKIVSSSTVQQNLGYFGILPDDAEGRPSFAEATGASKVIDGSYYRKADSLFIWSKIIDAFSGEVLHNMPTFRGLIDQPMDLVDRLSQQIAGYWMDQQAPGTGKMKPPKMEAYKYWLEGRDAYGKDNEKSLRAFDKAIELDSDFVMPYIGKLAVLPNDQEERRRLLRVIKQRDVHLTPYEKKFLKFAESDNPDEAFQHIMEIHKIDPNSFMEKNIAADIALRTNRPEVTLKILGQDFDTVFVPGNHMQTSPTILKVKALYQTGQYEEAIDFIRHIPFARRRGAFHRVMIKSLVRARSETEVEAYILSIRDKDPEWWAQSDDGSVFHQLASAEYALIDQEQKASDFAKQAEQHLSTDSRAYTYLITNQREKAEKLYSELIREDPDNPVYIAQIGALKAELGEMEEALKSVHQLIPDEKATSARQKYLAATVLAQLGKYEEALKLLREAYAEGFRFDDNTYAHDPLLEPMKNYEPYLEFIRPKNVEGEE
jgi:class 3 adenylate cyclase/TolB-like protein